MPLIFRDDAYARSCPATVTAIDERGIRLDSTVFYPTGGGEPGENGVLRGAGGDILVVDKIKRAGPGEGVPGTAPGAPPPGVGEPGNAGKGWEAPHRGMGG